MLLESFDRPDCDTLPMTDRTFVEILSYLFADFLWFEVDRIDLFPALATKKSDISAFRIEVVFAFFPKRRDIYEIGVGSRHISIIEILGRLQESVLCFSFHDWKETKGPSLVSLFWILYSTRFLKSEKLAYSSNSFGFFTEISSKKSQNCTQERSKKWASSSFLSFHSVAEKSLSLSLTIMKSPNSHKMILKGIPTEWQKKYRKNYSKILSRKPFGGFFPHWSSSSAE